MFQFANSEYLYLLFLIPVLLFLFWLALHFRAKAIKKFGDWDIIKDLMPKYSRYRLGVKFTLLILAFGFLIIAIAQPRFISKIKTENKTQKGVEIMIALDISNSMMAEDIKPNRLINAKRAIYKLIEKLKNDKIGLIVFAGDAYIQLPITTDYDAAKLFLRNIDVGFIPKQGTSIGSAIKLAMRSFSPENDKNKALIIITDGENHEDNAIEMAEKARESNIFVHTIGMGLPKGAPIPIYNRGQKSYKKNKEGTTVISKLNEKMLAQIAGAGEGSYVRANNTKTGLNILFEQINKMNKDEIKVNKADAYENYFMYFIGFALFLLLLDFLILEKRNKLLDKIYK